jgi:ribosomal protein S12 methylthiotransferase accessory factor
LKVHSLEDLFSQIEYLVDDHVGIVRKVLEIKREAGAPDIFCFSATPCDTSVFGGRENFSFPGGAGASIKRESALAKAVGEAVERYSGMIYDLNAFPLVSFETAPFRCVPPDDFALYSAQQYSQSAFPYVRFDKATPVRWLPALDLGSGETWYLPAGFVFLNYLCDNVSGESSIAQSISTGLACHTDPIQCAISAICEVIERDAFTITWQAKLSPPQINTETLSHHNRDLVKRLECAGGEASVFNISLDHGIPTIMAVLKGRSSEAPSLLFTAAAAVSPDQAIKKALEELAHSRIYAQFLKRHLSSFAPGPGHENVVSLEDHLRLYLDYQHAPLANFIFASKQKIDFNEIKDFETGEAKKNLKSLVDKIQSMGNRVLLADVTTADVRELGLSVLRAVIPGFHPLFFGHKLRALGGTRLWEIPQKMGYRGITQESGDNQAPHPFP